MPARRARGDPRLEAGAVSAPLVMALALGIEAIFGWPERLNARISHPVVWIGALIDALDRRLNRATDPPARRIALGGVATAATVAAAAGAGAAAEAALPEGAAGLALAALLAWPLVAARSLHDHVALVGQALAAGDLGAARAAVMKLVGRDPTRLDEAGVARAALESLAENASDGVTAPLLWGALFGLPGIAGYKAVNTLDSMIGHRTERHLHFGRIAARLDDAANWIPARLTGLAFATVSAKPGAALAAVGRDARRHRSPNAGWPEAALAGALGVRLSGPRVYHDRLADEPWLNGAAPDPTPAEMGRALSLYRRAAALIGAALLAAGLLA
jgi:adenosylcobinamide-phosphate synthase